MGRLQTREGAPAAAVRISALPAPPVSILPSDGQNYFATTTPASTALTDAQGRYRLTNLAPGRYLIVASAFGYPTFHPGTTSADRATAVTVGADSPADGIDFTVLMPPGGRVSGRVDRPPTAGVPEIAVLSGLALGELLETPVGADGAFTFGHLPKGAYLRQSVPHAAGHAVARVPGAARPTRASISCGRSLRRVSGRLVAQRGSLPRVLLGFSTERSYVTADCQRGRYVQRTAAAGPSHHRARRAHGRLFAGVRSSRCAGRVEGSGRRRRRHLRRGHHHRHAAAGTMKSTTRATVRFTNLTQGSIASDRPSNPVDS